ncbi:MAG: putative toxin-antitoxin system toxin component, PIN family [Alphaproteobacteria bacterium 16-39-46]|nr:MAG: putative toxin-antitoxin system toxin component, PIN family [Alphaproteobacteria bacterium 16-39-46]OZA42345.1 MAG: putative toxin-antitoxin system toxin component, PIN family [Alphaproteobacteria bacterium 17-39-52]HQS84509.1 putative toxin-antitoxin system toxin component, PIN family [Alphaproteobacteria bacterium]HQS94303.1 putative toxin-antitoxin system toxin component, PIN family [Alphaproteobacteria bacterium]
MNYRLVLDANVFASSLINPKGPPGIIVSEIINNPCFTLLLSEPILEELKRILFYPKVRKRIMHTDQDLELWILSLQLIAHIVIPKFTYPILVEDDPTDDKYIVTGIEGGSHFIISGDKHLLNLKTYQGIKIITAAEFLNILTVEKK